MQEVMFFVRKTQLEKVQITRDLKNDTILYQVICLIWKKNQGFCDPTLRTRATLVWFSEDTCTPFQVAKTQAKLIKLR